MGSKRLVAIAISLFLFVLFILFTDPKEISLAIVLVPFFLLGVIFYNLFVLLIERFFKQAYKKRKIRLFALVCTVMLVNFGLLSSIGQLTPQDTILAALITLVGAFYLYKFQIG